MEKQNVTTQQAATSYRLLRRKQVEQVIGLSRSAIYSHLDKKSPYFDPTFPRPIRMGSVSIAWLENEIQQWIASRVADSRKSVEV